jgi:NADPH:quinone reductase-like Zn-dependent oxidoreductase
MKAVVQREYGPADRPELAEVAPPTAGADEVLVRVYAASVHPDVWHVVRGEPAVLRLMGAGLRRPIQPVPGTDVAGRVEAVGADVSRFRPGDAVFGETIRGRRWVNGGAYAEYATAPADALAHKPGRLSFEAAAAVPTSGLIALQAVRSQGQVRDGRAVLVNGAGGGVGHFAVQITVADGATVAGVDAGEKLEVVRSLGADRVVDYTREDFTRRPERYDCLLDVPGNHSLAACERVLTDEGLYVLLGHDRYGATGRRVLGSVPRFARLTVRSRFSAHLPPIDLSTPPRRESMAALTELIELGESTPVVDGVYPLDAVPEALAALASGDVVGKVVVGLDVDEPGAT